MALLLYNEKGKILIIKKVVVLNENRISFQPEDTRRKPS